MRAAAIFGLGCSPTELRPFQKQAKSIIDWRIGLPAASDDADVILLFGGDGTIHRHLSQLVKLAKPVLIVPAGSGNDFARALGLRSVRDSLRAWQGFSGGKETLHAIDLGVITPTSAEVVRASKASDATTTRSPHTLQHYFCAVAGIGLDSEVARRANTLPPWLRGHGGYALTLAPTIFRFVPSSMRISALDESGAWTTRSNQPTILAAFANTSTYGGGMRIAPHAKLDDGELDVCVIAGIDPFKLFCLFPTVYFGRHLNIRGVEYFRSPRVRIETKSPLDIYADGEYACPAPVEIATERAALRVIK
jgi:diacylglycerol kinase (ATP)